MRTVTPPRAAPPGPVTRPLIDAVAATATAVVDATTGIAAARTVRATNEVIRRIGYASARPWGHLPARPAGASERSRYATQNSLPSGSAIVTHV